MRTLPFTDAEVIERSRREPEAFGAIFDRYYSVIASYLRRRLTVAIAEDQAAEVFVIAFRRRFDYDLRRGSAKPWLFGIASNLIRSSLRSELLRVNAYARAPTALDPDDYLAADSRLDAAAKRNLLVAALASLRVEERDVLLLFSWAELSYAEIAEALDIEIGTVRSRLSRGRARMLAQINGDKQASEERMSR